MAMSSKWRKKLLVAENPGRLLQPWRRNTDSTPQMVVDLAERL